MFKKKKGFSLIELLVVVAIIGILSSVVIVSVFAARKEAVSAKIVTEMVQLRSMAFVVYSNGSFSELECTGGSSCNCQDGRVESICADIYKEYQRANLVIFTDEEYCAQVDLPTGGSFCIDSSGYAGEENTDCDGTDYSCN